MDIMTVFETVVGGSSPSGGIRVKLKDKGQLMDCG